MKRRGFLGLIGGAAVAGPAAAKNIVSEALPLSGNSVMTNLAVNSSYGNPAPGSSGGFLGSIDRITKLKRLISGEEVADPEPYDMANRRRVLAENHINSLGSVSIAGKMKMLQREMDRISAETRKRYWMQELKELMAGNRS